MGYCRHRCRSCLTHLCHRFWNHHGTILLRCLLFYILHGTRIDYIAVVEFKNCALGARELR